MTKVRCYWNLHRHCWSVQDARTRKVIGHAAKVLLRDVTFTVSAAGRERVLREQRKNVHAYACGEIHGADWLDSSPDVPGGAASWWGWTSGDQAYTRYALSKGEKVSYNPYKAGFFQYCWNGERVDNAPMALLGIQVGKAALYAFDPCNMTAAESAAATV
jgi:hypothetical protein